jgi:ribosomal protein S18 acetylase RimI-like enzyme
MIKIIQADYYNPYHGKAILELLNRYAMDDMGGAQALSEFTRDNLISELSKRDFALSLLAFKEGEAVGLLNAFEGFSSFRSKGLFNIHDIYVNADCRGQGIAQAMIEELKRIAHSKGFCKLTLEVLSNNVVAQNAYRKSGFEPYVLKDDAGEAQFWQMDIR